jgi:hypothetical protein
MAPDVEASPDDFRVRIVTLDKFPANAPDYRKFLEQRIFLNICSYARSSCGVHAKLEKIASEATTRKARLWGM